MLNFPSFSDLSSVFINEDNAILYLVNQDVINRFRICECGNRILLNLVRKVYRCSRKSCRKEVSIFNGSFFYFHKIPVSTLLHFSHLWLSGSTSSVLERHLGLNPQVVADYSHYLRELVADSIDILHLKIGGEGVIIEIDESKFGKRKYERGHRVEGIWILGGVERTDERRMFLVPVPDRTETTLLQVIATYVLPGSIIYSDLWRAYYNIEDNLGFSHYTVNHSLHFVDPDTGVHTNTIEGSWSAIKRSVPVRNRVKDRIDLHLLEFLWRRINSGNLWDGFIGALRDVTYY